MPNLFLDPIAGRRRQADRSGRRHRGVPAGLDSRIGSPTDVPARELDDDGARQRCDDLALEHLKTRLHAHAGRGVSERRAFPRAAAASSRATKSSWSATDVDRKADCTTSAAARSASTAAPAATTFRGFEDAKPIGTGLADWGRKTADKLAFEQIVEYMKHGARQARTLASRSAHGDVTDKEIEEAGRGPVRPHAHGLPELASRHRLLHGEAVRPSARRLHLAEAARAAQLRLQEDGEQGLQRAAADAASSRRSTTTSARRSSRSCWAWWPSRPPPQYVYQADAAPQGDRAGLGGHREVQLHRLPHASAWTAGSWPTSRASSRIRPRSPTIPFLQPHFTPQQIKASLATDAARPAARHARSACRRSTSTASRMRMDEDGAPIDPDDTRHQGVLFVRAVGQRADQRPGRGRPACRTCWCPSRAIEKRYPPIGGFLARLAYPAVVAAEKTINPNAKADEAWGWLPPPLVGEGRKVQTDWLHDFLLDPYPIRPAVVLRMPKFNMSPAEATPAGQLLCRRRRRRLSLRLRSAHARVAPGSRRSRSIPNRLDDALKIVTDSNYCIEVPPGGRLHARRAASGPRRRSWTRSTSGCGPTSCWPGSPIPSGCCPTRACRSTFRTTSR